MGPLIRLDEQFRLDRLPIALGLLLVSATGLVVCPKNWAGVEVALCAVFVLTGIMFVHQFGTRGGPLSLGFLAAAGLAGMIGISWEQRSILAAGSILAAFSIAVYSAWIASLQTDRDHRQAGEADLTAAHSASSVDVRNLGDILNTQERRLKTWSSMVGVVRGCSSTLKFEGLASFVLESVGSLFPEDAVSLRIGSSDETPDPAKLSVYEFHPEKMSGRVLSEQSAADGLDLMSFRVKQNILVTDQNSDYRFQGTGVRFSGRSALVCPLMEKGSVFGSLRVTSHSSEKFGHDDMNILSHIAGVVSMTALNVRLYERTEELALTDQQTGLFKRYYFERRFLEESKRALRHSSGLAMMLFDIDFFKRVNDTWGHASGDQVLIQFGKMIREVDWGGPIPCRWGGEEFLLVLPDATPEQARARAEAVTTALKRHPFRSGEEGGDGKPFVVTASVGLATFPRDSKDPDMLFQICDRRLYAAKNSGRDRIVDRD